MTNTKEMLGSALRLMLGLGLVVGLFCLLLELDSKNGPPPRPPREAAVWALMRRLPAAVTDASAEDYWLTIPLRPETEKWLVDNEGWTRTDFETLNTLCDFADLLAGNLRDPARDIAGGYVRGIESALWMRGEQRGDLAQVRAILRSVPRDLVKDMQDKMAKARAKGIGGRPR